MDVSKLRVGIFCSSRDVSVTMYEQSAIMLIHVLKEIGIKNIVYGGGKKGLMGIVYRESLKHNINIVGHNIERWSTPDCEHEILYQTLNERQTGFIDSCDLFIALSGGIGTLYEIIQVLCHNDVDKVNKPVLLYNYNSYFSKMTETLQDMAKVGMIDSDLFLSLINTNDELVRIVLECVELYKK